MALEVNPEQPNKPQVTAQSPSDKGKNVAITLIVVLVILVVLAAVWFTLTSLNTSTGTTTTTTTPTTQSTDVPDVKSDADLEKLENEVKNTNIDDLGTDLDANDSDAASF